MKTLELSPTARVTLIPLHIGPVENGLHEVGDARAGHFIALPKEGVFLVSQWDGTQTIQQTRQKFRQEFGVEPDLADFLTGLIGCGFVSDIDGRAVSPAPTRTQADRGWRLLAGVRQRRVAWLLSRPAVALGAGLWPLAAVLLATRPELWPGAQDAIVLDRATLSVAVLAIIGWVMVL
ncbi:MAG: hypothetical protein ACRC0L_08685, partial [Angustibacter sp.]